ncbi:MAG TPA: nucleotide disphospho-sugar-binding domain-containing protein [Methylococcaceae bacterium]|nr:nucleotide disphospho-sugar-binding domain-containing protein [Methylococcaceae bacterium]
MTKVVFAWELGSDLGHMGRMLPIATRLHSRGVEVEFLIRDLSRAELLLGKNGFDFLPAPYFFNKAASHATPPINYSDILLRYGYHNADCLTGLLKSWLRLFAYSKPDLILADHSPTALLAARIAGLPAAEFGTGFTSPPLQSPFPNMRPWIPLSKAKLEQPERALLAVINSALSTMGIDPLDTASAIFASIRERFLCTFAELDHYPHREAANYRGVLFTDQEGVDLDWPTAGEHKIYAYLKATYPAYKEMLSALSKMGHSTIVYCPDIPREIFKSFNTKNIRISSKPVRLAGIAPQCDLAITHAGHGTLASMLLHGVPLLLLPTQLEQFLAASRMEALGAALIATPDAKGMNYPALLERLLTAPSFRQAAGKFQRRYADFAVDRLQDRLAVEIASLADAP